MKKLWILTAVIGVCGLVGVGFFVFRSRQQAQPEISMVSETPTPTPVPFDLTTWSAEAGFTFQYPKDLTVNRHEEDPDNYAHVELTSSSHPGKIIVWLSDLPKGVTTIDQWAKLPQFKTGTVIDTTLDDRPAKKILVTSPVKTLSVGMITSDNLLYNVEATLTDSEYWQRVEDTVVSTLTEKPPETSSGAGGGGPVDETEVLQ